MCGYAGFCNLNEDLTRPENIHTLEKLTKSLTHRGPDENGYFISEHANLGHNRLIIIDAKNGKQPMSYKYNENTYTIVYNGQLYNSNEIRNKLIESGFNFNGYSDTEVILKAFIHYGIEIFKEFNGIFSFVIWNESKKEITLCRDHFGIKPLFYSFINNTLIFASEIKSILSYPNFEAKLDKQGICELFGISPSHTPGTCIFKNIYELKPAHFAIFNESGFSLHRYWKLETKQHKDTFKETCSNIKFLLEDSIKNQLVSDVPLCAMLSGGLDSSIIIAYASKFYKEQRNVSTSNFIC